MKKLAILLVAIFAISCNLVAQSQSPYFLVKGSKDQAFPLQSTKADVNIAGVIADVKISQVYQNKGNTPIEAVYVFPGSTDAAVYAMQMKIGERIIHAKIQEKNKARAAYIKAKSEGKRTSLLEQNRPNVFTMNVANILPSETIEVQLRYTEMVKPTNGIYEFVYPTVVGPRYAETDHKGKDTYLNTPYTKAGAAPLYDFDFNLTLNAGMPIQDIQCNTHQVNIDYPKSSTAALSLKPTERKGGNRDLIVLYQLAGQQIQSGLMLYEGEQENFFSLMVQPPKQITLDMIPPREYIFVMDVSGSMRGFPLDVSKKLMRNLIAGLRPTDRFNVLLFAGTSSILSQESLFANEDNIDKAMHVIDKQRGGGSTRLLPALKKALQLPRCEREISRSVVVVTDGYINVEAATFDLIRNNLDKANLFTFGIGSSVNRHLIEGMAHIGQGEPFVVTTQKEAPEKANVFKKYIENPVLTQIQQLYQGFEVYDVQPNSIPDVFAERPIILFGKYRGKAKGNIQISGYHGNQVYTRKYNVADVKPETSNSALKYLWARERIKVLDDYAGVSNKNSVKEEVTALGLKYNLMTEYTSFIAIDENEIATEEQAKTVKQPLPMPAGVPNSAVGFEASFKGKSKAFKTGSNYTISIIESSLTKSQTARLKRQLSKLINQQLGQCHKAAFKQSKALKISLEMDKNGQIMAVHFLDQSIEEPIRLCLIAQLKKKEIKGIVQNETSIVKLKIQQL